MVIVLRCLEVGAPVKGREALPHGHSVADWPLLRPLVGFLNRAVMTGSEDECEHILSTLSREMYSVREPDMG
jgi:hypothetical protein